MKKWSFCSARGVLMVALCAAAAWQAPAQAAAFATGGTGQYKNQILWLTWGAPGSNGYGTHGQALPVGSSTSATFTVAGQPLEVTCRITDIKRRDSNPGAPGGLLSYRPGGGWSGDALDDLYNINGTDASNQLIAGIANVNSPSPRIFSFDVACTATLNGAPYDLPGVVVADAEQLTVTAKGTYVGSREYITATADGQWRIIERGVSGPNCPATPYMGSVSGTKLTLEPTTILPVPSDASACFAANNGNRGPAAVGYLEFNPTAFSGAQRQVSMSIEIKGNGVTAVALGLMVPQVDYGDAPASYGVAGHMMPALSFGADGGLSATPTNINSSSFTLATPDVTATTDKLGRAKDAEVASQSNDEANGDDINGWLNDEDGVNPVPPLADAATYSVKVTCSGTGYVRGWVDFNGDGVFDADEASTNTPQCGGPSSSVTLNFPGPASLAGTAAVNRYLRVRYARNVDDIASPTGLALSGEVEDYVLPLSDLSPKLGTTPSVVRPGQVFTGLELSCTNAGPSAAVGGFCRPKASAGTVSSLACAPDVATLPAGATTNCTYDYTAPGALGGLDEPTVSVTFSAVAGADNDRNGGTGTGGNNQIDPASAPKAVVIDALDDATTNLPPGATGATFNLAANDQYPVGSVFTMTGGTCAGASVNGAGVATFTVPASGSCTVLYQVCAPAPNDAVCDTATATITASGGAGQPTASNDTGVMTPGQPVTVAVLGNDPNGAGADAGSVQLINPPAGATLSPDGKTLVVPGEGTWTVNDANGSITFAPAPGFTGVPTPVGYFYRVRGVASNVAMIALRLSTAVTAVPTLDGLALLALSGVLAALGMRRRRQPRG